MKKIERLISEAERRTFQGDDPRPTEEDRKPPQLGLTHIKLYEPQPVEVCGRRRRGLEDQEMFRANTQPRSGKKGNGPERMTTKEGEPQRFRLC